MRQVNFSTISKPIAIITITAFLLMLAMTITAGVRGSRVFTLPSTNQSYFIQKYTNRTEMSHRLRLAFSSIAMACLIVLIVLALSSILQQKQQKQSVQKARIIYALASLTILCVIVTTGYHLTFLIERHKTSRQVFWDEISMFVLGIIALILMIICWSITTRFLIENNDSKAHSKGRNHIDDEYDSQRQRMLQLQNGLKRDQENIQKELIQDGLFDRINVTPINNLKQSYRSKKSLVKKNVTDIIAINHKIIQPDQDDIEEPHKEGKNFEHMDKLSKRKEELKMQIQKRKKKFRELNPLKLHEKQDQQQDQYQSVNSPYKLSNLHKSYRQYIKAAKRPKRKTPATIYPIVKQIGSVLLQEPFHRTLTPSFKQMENISNKDSNIFQNAQNKEDVSDPNLSKLQAKIRQYRMKKSALVLDMSAEQQLVHVQDLKAKKMKKKNLFEQTVDLYRISSLTHKYVPRIKNSTKDSPTMQEQILRKLQGRQYGAQQEPSKEVQWQWNRYNDDNK